MKNKLLNTLTAVILLLMPNINFGQAPTMGTTANYALFTTVGLCKNTGITYDLHITGNVGSNSGAVSGFGNVDGVMSFPSDPLSMQAEVDLLVADGQLDAATPNNFPTGITLGSGPGQILFGGIHAMTAPLITLDQNLILDAQNDPTKVFIFQLHGAFSSTANAKVKLINGALACNVFWKTDGAVNFATGTSMKGTIVATAAISFATLDTLEGRALAINGDINVNTASLIYTPIGCNSPAIPGPVKPNLASVACYTIFSSNGALTNGAPPATSIGDVGNNGIGAITGWNAGMVIGTLHLTQDASTIAATTDLSNAYNYINALPIDIELLAPLELGHNLVLTPHVYHMGGDAFITDTLILNALGDANAVFVIQITAGSLSTQVGAAIKLINGAQSQNVFWMVSGGSGQVDLNNFVTFRGTIIVPAGAINMVNTGVVLDGRALTMVGAIVTTGLTAIMPPGCGTSPVVVTDPINDTVCAGDSASFSVTATGSGLTYQWMNGNTPLVNGGNISGADSATLYIYPTSFSDTSSFYNVIVNGYLMPSDTSINVSLTINTAPVITMQPSPQAVCEGDSIGFVVVATGTALTYQWRKGLTNIFGATNDTLTIDPANISDMASDYNVVVTGACSPAVTSLSVSLDINTTPIITLQPVDQTVCAGDTVSFTVAATGTNLTYQWMKGNIPLVNIGNISGADSTTLTISGANVTDSASNYNVVITGACLPNAMSVNVSLTVNPIPVAVASSNSPICEGSSLSISAQPSVGATYSWSGPNGYNSSSQDSVIVSATVANSGTYILTVSKDGCSDTSTTVVAVNVCFTDLSIVKTASNMSPFIGKTIVFTIVATNNGTDNGTGVEVNDILQSGYTYVSSTLTGGTYDPATGVWTIDSLNNGASETLTVTVTVNADGNYVNTAIIYGTETDLNMANNVSSVEPIPTDFFIPEGFSPNGDGINDVFVIRGILNFPENTFVIFNRWGNKVYETSSYKNTWDGKTTLGLRVGGDELPIGTYFYILDLKDGSDVFKGTIYLNR